MSSSCAGSPSWILLTGLELPTFKQRIQETDTAGIAVIGGDAKLPAGSRRGHQGVRSDRFSHRAMVHAEGASFGKQAPGEV
jgi:hypothetical protein